MAEENKTWLYDTIAADDINERLVDGVIVVSDDNVETVLTVNSSGNLESKKGADPKKTYTDATGFTDEDAIHDNVDGEINAITEKTTPVDADLLIMEDSADTYSKKKVQMSNIPLGDIDGGSASSVYLASQTLDGGNASGV
jgi:hypothetical protein